MPFRKNCTLFLKKTNMSLLLVLQLTLIDLPPFTLPFQVENIASVIDTKKKIVEVVKEKSQHYSELYAFNKMLFYSKNLEQKLEDRGFVMFVRLGNPIFERIMEKYKDKNPLLIYSMWHGYIEQQPKIKNAMDTYRSIEIHTSGHADFESTKELIAMLYPKYIIPIHTENASAFSSISNNVILLNDKDVFSL